MKHKVAIRVALFALGFISIATQIYLIREFLSVFYGNELVFGVSLANWMLLTGFGAWLGRFATRIKGKISFGVFLFLLLSLLPTLMILKLDFFRVMVFPYGSMISLWQTIYATFLIQLPFCLINGYLFTSLSFFLATGGSWTKIPGAYAMESLGSMISGILVNFVLLWLFAPFSGILFITLVFLLLVCVCSWLSFRPVYSISVILVSVGIMTGLFLVDFQSVSEKLLYKGQRILANENTPYGQVVITGNEGQLNFFENGILLFSSGNLIRNEESVHIAMVQHAHPERVLLVSGGISGTIEEILKYHPGQIDYVELNPSLVTLSRKFIRENKHPGIRTHITDARKFIKEAKDPYDVVLINLPEPSSLQINRFYTVEFFRELKRKLNPGAVISVSLPTTSNYVSEQAGKLNSSLYLTLGDVFLNVRIIPLERNYFLASDARLDIDIPGLIRKKSIPTTYVNDSYLDNRQIMERSSYVMKNISAEVGLNHDFRPVAFIYQLDFWLSHFESNIWILAIILAVTGFLILATLKPVSAGIFTGGFTGASMEVILVLSLQIIFGYLFQIVGVIIMLFMLGLTVGSGMTKRLLRNPKLKHYLRLQVLLAIFSLLIPLFLFWISSSDLPGWFIQIQVGIFTFIISFIVGMEYRMASCLSTTNLIKGITGNYSADLFGSAFGALIVTVFLLPLMGFIYTGIVLALLNALSAVILFLRRKKIVPLY